MRDASESKRDALHVIGAQARTGASSRWKEAREKLELLRGRVGSFRLSPRPNASGSLPGSVLSDLHVFASSANSSPNSSVLNFPLCSSPPSFPLCLQNLVDFDLNSVPPYPAPRSIPFPTPHTSSPVPKSSLSQAEPGPVSNISAGSSIELLSVSVLDMYGMSASRGVASSSHLILR